METLPEKWAFKVTQENYKKFKHLRNLLRTNGYITSRSYCSLNWGGWIPYIGVSNYTLIPFELFEKHYLQPKDSIVESSKPEPKFKVGDTVTYKYTED